MTLTSDSASADVIRAQRWLLARERALNLLQRANPGPYERDELGQFASSGTGSAAANGESGTQLGAKPAPAGKLHGSSIKGMPASALIHVESLREGVDRNAFDIEAKPARIGTFEKEGDKFELTIKPKLNDQVAAYKRWGGSSENSREEEDYYYNPELAELVTEDYGGSLTRTFAKVKEGVQTDIEPLPDSDAIYRGISSEEWDSIQRTGEIKSKGEYNIGEAQRGLTYYTTQPDTAAYYASDFAPWQYKATFEKPAYVVAVRKPSEVRDVPGTAQNEVGVSRAMRKDEIVAIWRGDPYSMGPGKLELRRSGYEGDDFVEGSRANLTSSVAWSRIDKAKSKTWLQRYHGENPDERDEQGRFAPVGTGSGSITITITSEKPASQRPIAAAVTPEHPELRKWKTSDEAVATVNDAIAQIPALHQAELSDVEVKVAANELVASELHPSQQISAGFATYDTRTGKITVVIPETIGGCRNKDLINTTLHEMGHAYDYRSGMQAGKALSDKIQSQAMPRMTDEELKNAKYYLSNPDENVRARERFAETYSLAFSPNKSRNYFDMPYERATEVFKEAIAHVKGLGPPSSNQWAKSWLWKATQEKLLENGVFVSGSGAVYAIVNGSPYEIDVVGTPLEELPPGDYTEAEIEALREKESGADIVRSQRWEVLHERAMRLLQRDTFKNRGRITAAPTFSTGSASLRSTGLGFASLSLASPALRNSKKTYAMQGEQRAEAWETQPRDELGRWAEVGGSGGDGAATLGVAPTGSITRIALRGSNPSLERIEQWKIQLNAKADALLKEGQAGSWQDSQYQQMLNVTDSYQRAKADPDKPWHRNRVCNFQYGLTTDIDETPELFSASVLDFNPEIKTAVVDAGGLTKEDKTAVLQDAVVAAQSAGMKRVEASIFSDSIEDIQAYQAAGFHLGGEEAGVTTMWWGQKEKTPEEIAFDRQREEKRRVEHNNMVTKSMQRVARDLDFDASKISLKDNDGTEKFVLNGRECKAAGLAYIHAGGREEQGSIVLYPDQIWDEEGAQGVTAHEIKHIKFQQALDQYQSETTAVMKEPGPPPNPDGEHRWEQIGGKDAVMSPDGMLRPTYAEKYPVYHAMEEALGQYHKASFAKTDGVTNYSAEYWKKYENGGAFTHDFNIAVHETLAEMAKIKYKTGKFPDKYFGPQEAPLSAEQIAQGFTPSPPAKVSYVEQREGVTRWRNLYRAVEKVYQLERKKERLTESMRQSLGRSSADIIRLQRWEVARERAMQLLERASDHWKEQERVPGDTPEGGQFGSGGGGGGTAGESTRPSITESEDIGKGSAEAKAKVNAVIAAIPAAHAEAIKDAPVFVLKSSKSFAEIEGQSYITHGLMSADPETGKITGIFVAETAPFFDRSGKELKIHDVTIAALAERFLAIN